MKIIKLAFLSLTALGLTSCWPVVAGAGAAGGYMAHKEGYRVQSPVTDTND